MTTLLLILFTLAAFAWAVIASCWAIESRNHAERMTRRADVAIDVAAQTLIERNLMLAWFGGDNPALLATEVSASGRALRDDERRGDVALGWLDETTWPGGVV